MKDIQLDTGCSRTVVRRDLIDQKKTLEGESITIQCAHGDIVSYPLADVEILVDGKLIKVEAAGSNTLPRSVLLVTDVRELSELLEDKKNGISFAVLTRSRAQQKQREEETQRKEEESGARPTILEEEHCEEEVEQEETEMNGDKQEEDQEDADRTAAEENESILGEQYNFSEDIFHNGGSKEHQTKTQKREDRLRYARAEKEKRTKEGQDWTIGLTQEELRRLQEKDETLQRASQ